MDANSKKFSISAMYVTSDEPIAVYVSTVSSGDYGNYIAPDSLLVRPITESSTEYFITGYDNMRTTGQPS